MSEERILKLGVNVDHVATLRQARGVSYPDPMKAARLCMQAGAAGITMHLREDRRHIQDEDIRRAVAEPGMPLNLEMANTGPIVELALELRPEEVCLVPEKREELTTEGGLDVAGCMPQLRQSVAALGAAGIAVSLFIDPEPSQIEAAAELGVPYIELHTGTWCDTQSTQELDRLIEGAEQAHAAGLRVNAGHGITLDNLKGILEIPHLEVLNIGHSLVSDSIFTGIETAVLHMRNAMQAYRGGQS